MMNKRRIVNGVERSSKAYTRKFVYSKRLVERFVREELGAILELVWISAEAILSYFSFHFLPGRAKSACGL